MHVVRLSDFLAQARYAERLQAAETAAAYEVGAQVVGDEIIFADPEQAQKHFEARERLLAGA